MLTYELALYHFSYDSSTGKLTWRVPTMNRIKPGDSAQGVVSGGYWRVRIGGRSYKAHRVAWLMEKGQWPIGDIDHINGDPADNRIANLRDVSSSVNKQNMRKARADNKTGLLGAYLHKGTGKFRAQIWLPTGQCKSLGAFDTAQDAHEAYLRAKRDLHAGCTI